MSLLWLKRNRCNFRIGSSVKMFMTSLGKGIYSNRKKQQQKKKQQQQQQEKINCYLLSTPAAPPPSPNPKKNSFEMDHFSMGGERGGVVGVQVRRIPRSSVESTCHTCSIFKLKHKHTHKYIYCKYEGNSSVSSPF